MIHQSESDNVRLLTVDIQGDSKYQDKVIYIDATHKIEKILADKNNLYILSESGKEQFFKTFILKPNLELIPTGTILNLEVQNAGFFQDFKRSNMINGDILVMSDQKLVRVYHDQSRRVNPKLQNYYNFLPKLKETIKGRQEEFML